MSLPIFTRPPAARFRVAFQTCQPESPVKTYTHHFWASCILGFAIGISASCIAILLLLRVVS